MFGVRFSVGGEDVFAAASAFSPLSPGFGQRVFIFPVVDSVCRSVEVGSRLRFLRELCGGHGSRVFYRRD